MMWLSRELLDHATPVDHTFPWHTQNATGGGLPDSGAKPDRSRNTADTYLVETRGNCPLLFVTVELNPAQSMWAELSGENFRSPLSWVFTPSLHRSKWNQTALLKDHSLPKISFSSGEIAPHSLKFKRGSNSWRCTYMTCLLAFWNILQNPSLNKWPT